MGCDLYDWELVFRVMFDWVVMVFVLVFDCLLFDVMFVDDGDGVIY